MAEIIAFLTVLTIPVSWGVARLLWRVSGQAPRNAILRERAVTATAVAGLVTVFGLIFLNNDQPIPPLDLAATKIVTRATVLVAALVTSVYWLWLYRGGSNQK